MKQIITLILILSLCIAGSSHLAAQDLTPKEKGMTVLTDSFLRGQLKFLSSDYMEGRATFEKGGRLAAEYLASMLEVYGVEPAGDIMGNGNFSYFQNARFSEVLENIKQELIVSDELGGGYSSEIYSGNGIDFTTRNSASVEMEGKLVFAGYGLIDKSIGHNDFKGADLKGKFVVLLQGYPSDHSKYFEENRMNKYYEAFVAGNSYIMENGALGVIYITPLEQFNASSSTYADNYSYYKSERISPNRRRVINSSSYSKSLYTINVSPKIGKNLLNEEVITNYVAKAAKGAVSKPIEIKGKSVKYEAKNKTNAVVLTNVVGRIKGKNSSKALVVGAHYDHMGIKDGFIWNGADDNASGSVGVLGIAAAFKASGVQPEYDIIFAMWSGEELGLLGSRYFVDNMEKLYPDTEFICNVNLDMLARSYPEDKEKVEFDYEYSETNPEYKAYGESNIKEFKLNLKPRYSASTVTNYGGATDYVPFLRKGIPIMGFFSGMHEDYHKISDESSKLHWDKFYDLVRLGFLNTYDIMMNQ